MSKRRTPQETKEVGIKHLKETFEKNNRKSCPPDQIRKWEKMYERQILPQVYKKD